MLQIITEGNKILERKCKRVDSVDDTIRTICASMIDAMITNNGIGLAANQVGLSKRIVVFLDHGTPKALINPEITEMSKDMCRLDEGCLSLPETFVSIERPVKIKVKYRDLKGKPHYEVFEGTEARILQHEIDHLDGILMTSLVK